MRQVMFALAGYGAMTKDELAVHTGMDRNALNAAVLALIPRWVKFYRDAYELTQEGRAWACLRRTNAI